MKTKSPEAALLRQVLEYLKAVGVFAWRNNVAGIKRRDKSGREFYAKAAMKGASDVFGVLPAHMERHVFYPFGRFMALELKSPTGKVTPDQQLFLDSVGHAGGLALVVRSLDGLRAVFKELGIES
jgi:hypothetical protein